MIKKMCLLLLVLNNVIYAGEVTILEFASLDQGTRNQILLAVATRPLKETDIITQSLADHDNDAFEAAITRQVQHGIMSPLASFNEGDSSFEKFFSDDRLQSIADGANPAHFTDDTKNKYLAAAGKLMTLHYNVKDIGKQLTRIPKTGTSQSFASFLAHTVPDAAVMQLQNLPLNVKFNALRNKVHFNTAERENWRRVNDEDVAALDDDINQACRQQ